MNGHYSELDGYTVGFEHLPRGCGRDAALQGAAGRPLPEPALGLRRRRPRHLPLRGPRRGVEAGDAYYAPPGHIPVIDAGTELVEFSPTEEYARTMAVVSQNLAALQAA